MCKEFESREQIKEKIWGKKREVEMVEITEWEKLEGLESNLGEMNIQNEEMMDPLGFNGPFFL